MRQVIFLPLMVVSFCLFLTSSFSQNVGIGTTSPIAKLHVKGTADITQLLIQANTIQSMSQPLIRLVDNTGFEMMRIHTNIKYNAFIGYNAGGSNTTGTDNIGHGFEALDANTSMSANIAIGTGALGYQSFNTGSPFYSHNVAIGSYALFKNQPISVSTGVANTAIGGFALQENTIGFKNTAVGTSALAFNASGNLNVAIGNGALLNNIGGSYNIAIGEGSGTNVASANSSNTVSIGNIGWLNGFSNQVFLGNSSTTWIGGYQWWSNYSDARIKLGVAEDVQGLNFITRLRPVTYYRSIKLATELTGNKEMEDFPGKYDVEKVKTSGFLAQEVDQAAKDCGYNFDGVHRPKSDKDLYSLSYASFVVPLVKAVQELNAELKLEVAGLKLKNKELEQRLEKLERILAAGKH